MPRRHTPGAWANINYGSIYHALNQLTKEGFLVSDIPADGKPWMVPELLDMHSGQLG